MRDWLRFAAVAVLFLGGCGQEREAAVPVAYECNVTLEGEGMSEFGGAKGQQTLSTAYSGVLRIAEVAAGWHVEVNPMGDADALLGDYIQEAVSASALGGSIGIQHYKTELGADTWLVGEAQSAAGDLPDGYDPACAWVGAYLPFTVTATAPSDSDLQYVAVWVADLWVSFTTDNSGWTLLPVDGFSVAWEIGLTGAYRRAKITENIPADHTDLRDVRQRTGTGRRFANEETVVAVSATILDPE